MNLTYLWLICAISLACADLLLGTAYLLILGIAAAFGFSGFSLPTLSQRRLGAFCSIFSHRCPLLQSPEEKLIKSRQSIPKSFRILMKDSL